MASVIIYNLPDHHSGDTFEGVQFDVAINGTAANLTGATITMSFTRTSTVLSSPSQIEISTTPGRFIIRKQIISLTPGIYEYKIKIAFADGSTKTYIKGTWKING